MMDKSDFERLVPSIGGGPTFNSAVQHAYVFPEATGLSYEQAYVWVEALGWHAMNKHSAEIYRTLAEGGVPAAYVRQLRPSLNLYTVNDAVMYVAFYSAGVSPGYSRLMWSWSANTVLRFHAEDVDPGYGALDADEVARIVPADVLHPHRAGVPVEYALPLLKKEVRGQAVAEMWRSGIPLEYALTLLP